jgi:hypothetical protein
MKVLIVSDIHANRVALQTVSPPNPTASHARNCFRVAGKLVAASADRHQSHVFNNERKKRLDDANP